METCRGHQVAGRLARQNSSVVKSKASCLSETAQIVGFFFFFWSHCAACGILVPQPGTEPAPPALEAQILNHWTAREVPRLFFL